VTLHFHQENAANVALQRNRRRIIRHFRRWREAGRPVGDFAALILADDELGWCSTPG
jgi:hypothetical protein